MEQVVSAWLCERVRLLYFQSLNRLPMVRITLWLNASSITKGISFPTLFVNRISGLGDLVFTCVSTTPFIFISCGYVTECRSGCHHNESRTYGTDAGEQESGLFKYQSPEKMVTQVSKPDLTSQYRQRFS